VKRLKRKSDCTHYGLRRHPARRRTRCVEPAAKTLGIATLTNAYVRAVAGTEALIVDTRKTTPVAHAGEVRCANGRWAQSTFRPGRCSRDQGQSYRRRRGISQAVRRAKEPWATCTRLRCESRTSAICQDALKNGADVLLFEDLNVEELARLILLSREVSPAVKIEYSGNVTLENVRGYAEPGRHDQHRCHHELCSRDEREFSDAAVLRAPQQMSRSTNYTKYAEQISCSSCRIRGSCPVLYLSLDRLELVNRTPV